MFGSLPVFLVSSIKSSLFRASPWRRTSDSLPTLEKLGKSKDRDLDEGTAVNKQITTVEIIKVFDLRIIADHEDHSGGSRSSSSRSDQDP